MFKSKSFDLDIILQEGMSVIVSGRASVYTANGTFQIYCDRIEQEGLGELHIKFEKLKEKLNREGYFDDEFKKSREKAMELLFSMELSKNSYEETIENFIEDYEMDLNTIDVEYIKNVVKIVTDNVEAIDERVMQSLVNWRLDRVSKVNLTILRLAVGEMMFIEDVPGSVAINEAVELTKKYSDEKSCSFVNGVLDKVLKSL